MNMLERVDKNQEPAPARSEPRGVLPTYVTDELAVLSKASMSIRNSYEIKMTLFMAVSKNLRFVLGVNPGAVVDESVQMLLQEHGGTIEQAVLEDYCVYVGKVRPNGDEEGWVLGDADAWTGFIASLKSEWLRNKLRIGCEIRDDELSAVADALNMENSPAMNIDDENVVESMRSLVASARQEGGMLFIQ
jgi:hypothetical protein